MPIHFRCQTCHARLSVSSRKAGSRAKCPKCGAKISVPAGDSSAAAAAMPPPAPPGAQAPPPGEAVLPRLPPAPGELPAVTHQPLPHPPAEPPSPASPDVTGLGSPVYIQANSPSPPELPPPQIVAASRDPAASPPAEAKPAEPDQASPPPAQPKPAEPGSPGATGFLSTAESPAAADESHDRAELPPGADTALAPGGAEPAALDPFAEFIVYDEAPEIVYEQEDDEPVVTGGPLPFDPGKVAVRREILYLQGLLLAVVALVSFGLGILLGASRTPSGAAVEEPRPCQIAGRIVLLTQTEALIPDAGAVALALPAGARLADKLELVGLRPQDPQLPDEHPALRAIRELGGDYARADRDGRYRLQVPDRGTYYLLVISASRRNQGAELSSPARAQLGRYFFLADDLFGGYAHRWQEETVRGDRELNFAF